MTLASARLKASVRFPPLRGMYQRGGTCKGCDSKRRKSTYRAPSGSPTVRSKGPSSPVPPEAQPSEQQPETRSDEGPEWVDKPFASIARGFRQARSQYEAMEKTLDQIGSELGVSPEDIIPTIRTLLKAQETDGLQIRIASLVSENGRLEKQVKDRNRRAEEAEAQTLVAASQASAAEARVAAAEARAAAAEEAQALAESESTKWHGVSRKFFDSFGFPSDMVTKARIFDQCMKKPEAVSAAKILHMLVDFSARIENLLKEIRSVFQLGDRSREAGPSEQRPKPIPGPSRPEPTSSRTATPAAPPTGAPSAPMQQPEATTLRPEEAVQRLEAVQQPEVARQPEAAQATTLRPEEAVQRPEAVQQPEVARQPEPARQPEAV